MVTIILALHFLQEILVVGNDDELEVRLGHTSLDNVVQALRKRLDIVMIEVCRGLVQGNQLFPVVS